MWKKNVIHLTCPLKQRTTSFHILSSLPQSPEHGERNHYSSCKLHIKHNTLNAGIITCKNKTYLGQADGSDRITLFVWFIVLVPWMSYHLLQEI